MNKRNLELKMNFNRGQTFNRLIEKDGINTRIHRDRHHAEKLEVIEEVKCQD